jgi:hypothetical protein
MSKHEKTKSDMVFEFAFTLFIATLTLAGVWSVTPKVWLGLNALNWVETTGVVTSVELEEIQNRSWVYVSGRKRWFEVKVRYEYEVSGQKHEGTRIGLWLERYQYEPARQIADDYRASPKRPSFTPRERQVAAC